MGPAVFNRHARVCSRTCGRWTLCSAPLSFCLTFSCSGSSVPCFRWELLQPSAFYRAPSDCHVLGEWMFSAWLQHLSRSPHLTQRSDTVAQLFPKGAWLLRRRTVRSRLPLPVIAGERRSRAPLLHTGTRGQPHLWRRWGASPSAPCCSPSPPRQMPTRPAEGMPSHRFYLLT